MKTLTQATEHFNQRANMNMEIIAEQWGEDFDTVKEYFHNYIDKHNMKPYAEFIKLLYIETEKELESL